MPRSFGVRLSRRNCRAGARGRNGSTVRAASRAIRYHRCLQSVCRYSRRPWRRAIARRLGIASRGNLNSEQVFPSMFEPVHSSAPDIFGQGVANPVDMIWSGALMLDFLCETQTDELIVATVKEATSEGPVLTPDFKGEVKEYF